MKIRDCWLLLAGRTLKRRAGERRAMSPIGKYIRISRGYDAGISPLPNSNGNQLGGPGDLSNDLRYIEGEDGHTHNRVERCDACLVSLNISYRFSSQS